MVAGTGRLCDDGCRSRRAAVQHAGRGAGGQAGSSAPADGGSHCRVVIGTLALLPARQFSGVLASQIAVAAGAALIPPALTALTLGIVGKHRFPHQQGRNQSWNHGGNVAASVLIVLLAGNMAGVAAFWVFAGMAAGSGLSLLLVRSADIDDQAPSAVWMMQTRSPCAPCLTDKRVLLLCFGLMTFHLGNAAMLPLLGQRLADVGHGNATRWLAICVTVAQFAMIGVAVIAGWAAQRFRQSWLFVILLLCLADPWRDGRVRLGAGMAAADPASGCVWGGSARRSGADPDCRLYLGQRSHADSAGRRRDISGHRRVTFNQFRRRPG